MALQADGRSDVYSAAFILYELITGQTPLHPLQPLASRVAGASDRLDAFFRRALARNPEERFARAGELTVAVGELLERDTEPMAVAFDSTVVVTVEKSVVHAYVRPGKPEALARGLKSVEQALQGPGRWKLVYDLSAVQSLGTLENVALIELHERCRERLDGVYFHAPIPHVRGSALVVGASVQGLPFKVFDSADSVRRHLQEGRP
ncbi:MAG TPA: hypothetical protein VND93_19410, partial [Myxococcales bacterium]|nr:hypothetical protein [Myxococcales bacterium]